MLSAESASPPPLFHLCGMPWPQVRMRCSHTSALGSFGDRLSPDSLSATSASRFSWRPWFWRKPYPRAQDDQHRYVFGFSTKNPHERVRTSGVGNHRLYTMWCDIFAAMCTTWAAPREDEAGQKAQIKVCAFVLTLILDGTAVCRPGQRTQYQMTHLSSACTDDSQ